MKIWNLVTVHHPEVVRVRVFFDADAAVAAGLAISPDTDGSIVPNPPEHVWEPFGGVKTDDRYSRGFFWLRNRVACLFTEDVHPCGCPEGVVTSALADRAEQCSSCGSTWDADDKLTAFRIGALNEAFAQAHSEDEAKDAELAKAWALAGTDVEEALEEAVEEAQYDALAGTDEEMEPVDQNAAAARAASAYTEGLDEGRSSALKAVEDAYGTAVIRGEEFDVPAALAAIRAEWAPKSSPLWYGRGN